MGSGTDVAKEASNMIITDDNFISIEKGIEEGRNAYSNIRKVVYLLLSCGISEVLFFTLSLLFNLDAPLVAIQLLWLNLVTDGFQDMALSFDKEENEIMKEKPRSPKESIFNKLMLSEVIISGVSIGLIVFVLWLFLMNSGTSLGKARGFVMTLMVFIQNVHVFNCRSEKMSIFKTRKNKNWFVIFSVTLSIGLQVLILNVPVLASLLKIESINLVEMAYMLLLSLTILVIMEIFKIFVRRKENN
jgi:magnesium-transporting ATPase (P-type)